MAFYYPPPGFHFKVEFLDIQAVADDILFQNVSGLEVSLETESIKEGGENRFEHVIPTRSKYNDLILKRGVLKDSGVIKWCRQAIESFEFKPTTVLVQLLNEEHEILIEWRLFHAWPKKWSVAELNAEQSAVLVETIELNYNYFKVNHSEPT
ncbi:phage tail protein [Negadavirga shengliensis]|uniref:Phage tail protein n=1 Tax=Negadavirga shengliensis TaxID=1389218 RepID=A0ABV9T607_9BACT